MSATASELLLELGGLPMISQVTNVRGAAARGDGEDVALEIKNFSRRGHSLPPVLSLGAPVHSIRPSRPDGT